MPRAGATGSARAQFEPLPSPILASPGTQHFVGSVPYPHSSFEADPSLITQQQHIVLGSTGPMYPPFDQTQQPWTWSGGGIAGRSSSITASNAPDGDFAAFLQSSAATGPVGFSFAHTLPDPPTPGRVWRISFLGAQREIAGVADEQNVRVTIAAIVNNQLVSEDVFDEPLIDATYRRYYSRPFVAQASSILVLFQGTRVDATSHTALIDMLNVRELLPWTETATWMWMGNDVPTQDDDVVIPATCCVGLKGGAANTVDLQGEMFVLDAGQDAALSTRRLEVHGPGSYFQVGLQGLPFGSKFELELDDDSLGSAPEVNALMIHDHGIVEMHGKRKTSWVRLAADAQQSSSSVLVDSLPTGWVSGDEIVIASSDRDFSHAEQRSVASVTPGTAGSPATIAINGWLAHRHCGTVRSVVVPFQAQPMVLDQRAEVGLLTHNVKVVGRARTTVPPGYGGHIMIHAGPTLDHPGFARFSGVEMENLGRSGQVGRYPIHWHMLLGNGKGQSVKHCSIHHSNFRVATIHGTDHVLFEGNVGYEHRGHGVFLEDGSEENNVIKDNLILGTRLPWDSTPVVLPSDHGPNDQFQNRAPASFWITNPHNTFVGNVAAGSEGTGYWFALPKTWLGTSSTNAIAAGYFATRSLPSQAPHPMPYNQTLGIFADNCCHSSWLGFDVHDSIKLNQEIDTNVTWRPHTTQPQTISRFLAYACNIGLYTGNGDTNIIFDHAVLADNSKGMAFASHDIVQNSAIVRDSGNGLWTGFRVGFNPYDVHALLLYDGAAGLDHVHMVGYDSATSTGPYAIAAFQGIGAARRRTNIQMDSVTCAATLTSTVLTLPWLGWADVSPPNPFPSLDYTLNSQYDPIYWAFSINNPDKKLGQLATSPSWETVVANHPMMLFNPGVLEMPLPNSPLGTTHHAFCSPFRFAYLRVICTELSGIASNTQQHPYPQFQLRYTREWETQSPMQVFPPFEDPWRVKFSKQMAVVVDRVGETNGIRYKLAWSHPTVQSAPLLTEIRLSELQFGEAALIGLENYLPIQGVDRATRLTSADDETVPSNAWATLTPAGDLPSLKQLSVSGYYPDQATGVLWIRIVATQSGTEAAIKVGADGLGQVIRVRR